MKARLLLLATVAVTGVALSACLGSPVHLSTGGSIGTVDLLRPVSDATLRQLLGYGCWLSWLAFAALATRSMIARRGHVVAVQRRTPHSAHGRGSRLAPRARGARMMTPPADGGRRAGPKPSRRARAEAMAAAHDTNGGVDVNGLNSTATRAAIRPRPIAGAACMQGGARDRYALLCSMVIEATGVRSGQFGTVILVGLGSGMHSLGDAIAVDSVAEALAQARGRTTSTAIFVGAPLDGAELGPLIELAEQTVAGAGPHLALVIGWPDDRAPLRLDAGTLQGASGFRAVERLAAARSLASANTDVCGTAADLATSRPGQPTDGRDEGDRHGRPGPTEPAEVQGPGQASAPPAQRPRTPSAPRPTIVSVDVLGPVRVVGVEPAFECRPKLSELVVYLALHREGATTEALATAIWPERRPPASTLSNRLSEARNALGHASDGSTHLRKRGMRHVLGEEVTTDWERFDSLAAREDDPDAWRLALTLVRGRPFDGLRETQWTVLEGIVPAMEAAVVEIACRLATVSLERADPYRADWAARRAMLACPWDERLCRIVMRAADAAGNRAGVEAALRQLAVVLEADPRDALRVVHAETAALYRELTSSGSIRRAN
jgi:DNA-binding SARP family transcriptional activator